jgi:hypothetical protein
MKKNVLVAGLMGVALIRPKESYIIRIGGQGCGVGYYK